MTRRALVLGLALLMSPGCVRFYGQPMFHVESTDQRTRIDREFEVQLSGGDRRIRLRVGEDTRETIEERDIGQTRQPYERSLSGFGPKDNHARCEQAAEATGVYKLTSAGAGEVGYFRSRALYNQNNRRSQDESANAAATLLLVAAIGVLLAMGGLIHGIFVINDLSGEIVCEPSAIGGWRTAGFEEAFVPWSSRDVQLQIVSGVDAVAFQGTSAATVSTRTDREGYLPIAIIPRHESFVFRESDRERLPAIIRTHWSEGTEREFAIRVSAADQTQETTVQSTGRDFSLVYARSREAQDLRRSAERSLLRDDVFAARDKLAQAQDLFTSEASAALLKDIKRRIAHLQSPTGRVQLFSEPNAFSEVVDDVASGTEVVVEKAEGEWLLVRTPSSRGYAHRDRLRRRGASVIDVAAPPQAR